MKSNKIIDTLVIYCKDIPKSHVFISFSFLSRLRPFRSKVSLSPFHIKFFPSNRKTRKPSRHMCDSKITLSKILTNVFNRVIYSLSCNLIVITIYCTSSIDKHGGDYSSILKNHSPITKNINTQFIYLFQSRPPFHPYPKGRPVNIKSTKVLPAKKLNNSIYQDIFMVVPFSL
jgi:hypothetical protein